MKNEMPFTNALLKFKNDVFFETGTYEGDTVATVYHSHVFSTIYSMELSPFYYERAKMRFLANPFINIFQGNSRVDLWQHISQIHVPITFWLDGHWSGVPYIGEDAVTKCPVLYELDQIKQHAIKTHTIMIDDIRLMDGDHFPVTRKQIEEKLYEVNPNYVLEYYPDDLDNEDVLVAYIK